MRGAGAILSEATLSVALSPGGQDNLIERDHFGTQQATISGGSFNKIGAGGLPGHHATIGGGLYNFIHSGAATIGGGQYNDAADDGATVPGGLLNEAYGEAAFAAGSRAHAHHQGAFVWHDGQGLYNFASTADYQFLIHASGGVGIGATNLAGALTIRGPVGVPPSAMASADNALALGLYDAPQNGYKWIQSYGGALAINQWGNNVGIGKTNPATALDVNGTVTAQSFFPTSDRNEKENFKAIDSVKLLQKVVALPLSEWNFKKDPVTRHIGPMAQDFHAAFGVGPDDKHIATVDADGVALAAIQGLHGLIKERDKRIAELEERLAEVERMLRSLPRASRNISEGLKSCTGG